MDVLNWVWENVIGNFSAIAAVILFVAYYKLNKRQKAAEVKQAEAEVKQTEAGTKQSEGGALATMQSTYRTFVEDYKKEYDELRDDVETLKKTDQQKDFVISDLRRKTDGLATVIGGLKKSLSEVEKIACIKIECPIRKPKLGAYKKEA